MLHSFYDETNLLKAGAKEPQKPFNEYSHDLVVGAVGRRSCLNEHVCGETGQDGNEFHVEPSKPGRGIKQREVHADDFEGAVHGQVSDGQGNFWSLWKQDRRKRL